MKINIGSGIRTPQDYINLDIDPEVADIVCDLRVGIPLEDESVDEILAQQIFEHFATGDELFELIDECARVLKPGGTILIEVPHKDSLYAFLPDHKSYWHETFVWAFKDRGQVRKFPFEIELVEQFIEYDQPNIRTIWKKKGN